MRLVVMIPCFNEEKTIGSVIKEIPRRIAGIDSIKVLLVDDGCTDDSVKIAKQAGADKVYSHARNMGLAVSFKDGLNEALKMKADIIVNIDADGQYNGKEIPKLIEPIIKQKADLVLTDRRVAKLSHMPFKKRWGNRLSTLITRLVSGYPVRDAQSGFRAFSRETALRLNIVSEYTYVQETIIQAAKRKFKIAEVPCEFRKRDDDSRLISSIWSYAKKAGLTIIRTYMLYRPLKIFLSIGALIFLAGLAVGWKVIYRYLTTGNVTPFLPTAILTAILLIIGFQVIVMGLLADLMDSNRKVNEEILYRLKKSELEK